MLHSASRADVAREIAPDVFTLGPWGRTQTNVHLVRSDTSWVLIDTGWRRDGPRIRRAAENLVGAAPLSTILLTHCHPDHAGSARELALGWGAAVLVHPAELPIARGDFAAIRAVAGPLDRWVVVPIMRAMGRSRREAALARASMADVAAALDPHADIPGLPGWVCIQTPGHTPGHVAFFRPADRVLISGDALVTLQVNALSGLLRGRQGLSGPPWYTTWSRRAARASIATLARLEPRVVAGGHGNPLTGPATADQVRSFAMRIIGDLQS